MKSNYRIEKTPFGWYVLRNVTSGLVVDCASRRAGLVELRRDIERRLRK